MFVGWMKVKKMGEIFLKGLRGARRANFLAEIRELRYSRF